jgi:hypothetical protein
VNFAITGTNDAPTAVADLVLTTAGNNGAAVIPEWALLANDTDPDSTTLDVASVSGATSGSVSQVTGVGSNGTVTFTDNNADGGTFQYAATDGSAPGASATVTVTNLGNANVLGSASAEILIGTTGKDNMNGGGGNDILVGNGGADSLIGGGGNDTIVYEVAPGSGGGSAVVIHGDAAAAGAGTDSDTLMLIQSTVATIDLSNVSNQTSATNTTVTGFENVDASRSSVAMTITGSSGTNKLVGGSAADAIKGLGGADQLSGGTGADTFKYTLVNDSNHSSFDTITDFTSGSDKIEFNTTSLSGISTSQGALGSATGSVSANSVAWFVDTANNQTIVYGNPTGGPLNGGNANLVEIHLAGAPTLAGTDFIFGGAPAGVAGEPVNLALTDPADHIGSVTLTIAGVPSGWTLSEGTDNGDGSWTVQTNSPSALTITAPNTFSGALTLDVMEHWTHSDGSAGGAIVKDNVEVYAPGSPIFALSSDDNLTGSSSHDQFVFAQPIGHDTIYNYDPVNDQIDLIGYAGFATFGDVQAHMADDANGNAVLTLADGQSITLDGVNTASFTASDFAFDATPVTHNAGDMTIGDGATLPLSGTIDNTGTIDLNSAGSETDLQLIEHGITFEGGGQLILSDSAGNVVVGTNADVALTNVDNTISGAGQLGAGQMTLVNEGTIDATGTNPLVIDTGLNVVENSGTLESTGSGGLEIHSDVANSGLIWANGGNVTVGGAVTGTGSAMISGAAALEFSGLVTENIQFAQATTGTLKLDNSAKFTGTVSNFGAGKQLDLGDIGFSAASMTYTENQQATGGTLTVTDGTHTANITLLGQYSADGFQASDDQHMGTLITYHPPIA